MAVAHDMFTAALRTAKALRPARLTHKFETFRVIEQRRQIDQNAHGSNLSRISREPYGFSQLRSAKAPHAEAFRHTAHLRRRAIRFHHPGTRDEPPTKWIIMVEAPMVRITGRRRPDRGTIGRSGNHRDYRMSTYPHMTDWRRQRDAGAFEALSPVNCGPKVAAPERSTGTLKPSGTQSRRRGAAARPNGRSIG